MIKGFFFGVSSVPNPRLLHLHVASDKIRGILLGTARNDFPAFYAEATARETQLMDMLVLLTALSVRLDEAQRTNTGSQWRDEERVATREMFDGMREFIRKSPTFAQLPRLEQQKIQRVIFDRVT